jgi:Fe2+ or Zn2+ uptake regulation protein
MVINKQVSKQRNTIQKIKILNFLRSVKTHPTAETVYKHVKKSLPTITLATVYRNLNQLAKNSAILRLEINKEYHYDADISYHQHFVCKQCGKIIDVFNKKVSEYALKKVNNPNLNIETVQVTYYGTCSKCGGNKK